MQRTALGQASELPWPTAEVGFPAVNGRFRWILLKNSLDKPLAYRRNAIFFGFSLEVWQAS